MKKIALFIAIVLLASLSLSVPISAQTWYEDYVLGVNSNRGNRGNDNTEDRRGRPEDAGRPDTEETEDDRPSRPENLRQNNFDELRENRRLSQEERQAKIQELRSLREQERCERIQTNLERRNDFYSNSYATHLSRYQGILVSSENIISRLDELGYDTTPIQEQVDSLEEDIVRLNELHQELVATLSGTSETACEDGNLDRQQLQAAAQETRETLQELRSHVLTMQREIRQELVSAIRSVVGDNEEEDGDDEPVSQPVSLPEDDEDDNDEN